jgi:hypothetical protein
MNMKKMENSHAAPPPLAQQVAFLAESLKALHLKNAEIEERISKLEADAAQAKLNRHP